MSELVSASKTEANLRRHLLMTASAVALVGALYGGGGEAAAESDSNRPTVWIELGGQLSRIDEGQQAFAPVFATSPARPSMFSTSQQFEHSPRYGLDETAKFSFQPSSSDWVLSASLRYGRSTSHKEVRQQTNPHGFTVYYNAYGRHSKIYAYPLAGRFADTAVQNGEQHLVLDFQAGKDVGLGVFKGENATSVLGLGVRFAQFTSKSNIALKSDPDWHFSYKYNPARLGFGFTSSKFPLGQIYHSNRANLLAQRSFHGIGPSLSWNGSAPLTDAHQAGELSFEWGLNAAVLFGRQRAKINQQLTGFYHSLEDAPRIRTAAYHPTPINASRTHTVAVPNVGGSIGLSWRIDNVKANFGYRGDFFFGAMDGGIETSRRENVDFHGPYASISVGLGG